MTDWIQNVLARYGQKAIVRTAEGEMPVLAFLQPIAEKREEVPGTMTGIGWTDGRLWLYLGQAAVSEGDSVIWNNLSFRVRSGRPYYIGETLTHWWAALEREREAAECGN